MQHLSKAEQNRIARSRADMQAADEVLQATKEAAWQAAREVRSAEAEMAKLQKGADVSKLRAHFAAVEEGLVVCQDAASSAQVSPMRVGCKMIAKRDRSPSPCLRRAFTRNWLASRRLI